MDDSRKMAFETARSGLSANGSRRVEALPQFPMSKAGPATSSPIALALGHEFQSLHPAVRRHYTQRQIDIRGTMDAVYVKSIIRPFAWLKYKLIHAPVPYGGRDVEISLHNDVDDSGTMHWDRRFHKNASFPETVRFRSRMVCSGDHRVIEFIGYGMGIEQDLSVDREGSLVYNMRCYVLRVPFLGSLLRIPTWLSPFGGGRTIELGETKYSFRVDFEMRHPIFGRTLAYWGRCRFVEA